MSFDFYLTAPRIESYPLPQDKMIVVTPITLPIPSLANSSGTENLPLLLLRIRWDEKNVNGYYFIHSSKEGGIKNVPESKRFKHDKVSDLASDWQTFSAYNMVTKEPVFLKDLVRKNSKLVQVTQGLTNLLRYLKKRYKTCGLDISEAYQNLSDLVFSYTSYQEMHKFIVPVVDQAEKIPLLIGGYGYTVSNDPSKQQFCVKTDAEGIYAVYANSSVFGKVPNMHVDYALLKKMLGDRLPSEYELKRSCGRNNKSFSVTNYKLRDEEGKFSINLKITTFSIDVVKDYATKEFLEYIDQFDFIRCANEFLMDFFGGESPKDSVLWFLKHEYQLQKFDHSNSKNKDLPLGLWVNRKGVPDRKATAEEIAIYNKYLISSKEISQKNSTSCFIPTVECSEVVIGDKSMSLGQTSKVT